MSADGDIVRADIVNAARTEIAKVDHGLASEPWAVRPLLQALDAALARLEAAEAQVAELLAAESELAEATIEQANHAEAQRDALAEALRKIAEEADAGRAWSVRELARAALAEAGLE